MCVQEWMTWGDEEFKVIILWVSNVVATLCMLPFLIIELVQLWDSQFDWTRSLWNILDVTLFALQLTCFILECKAAVDGESTVDDNISNSEKSLLAVMGFQIFFLFIKLQYFSR